jgi:N-acetylglucosaminyldiphosphoundecaprenol N-acetyl-beta-D-mannosaminyltransferase
VARSSSKRAAELSHMVNDGPTLALGLTDERILGISFFSGSARDAVDRARRDGGVVAMPASPALLKLKYDQEYRLALQRADLVLADSELLALLWRVVSRRRLKKISGISYLKCLLANSELQKKEKLFLIVSSDAAKTKAIRWLRQNGFAIKIDDCSVVDAAAHGQEHALLFEIEKLRPQHVIIALAGTGQEKLGLYLRDFLLYRPSIHCVGAALGFLTGTEHPIPEWVERSHLGWLSRLVSQPRMLLPRIGIAFILAGMVFKYRSELPRLKPRWADV